MSIVLLIIVIVFIICHSLRIVLNIHELVTLENIQASMENGCLGFPYWDLIASATSQFLITFNSSANFFIYCFISTKFRELFLKKLRIYSNGDPTPPDPNSYILATSHILATPTQSRLQSTHFV